MALTLTQLTSLGFKPSVRGRGGLAKGKKYDSLVLPLNNTDFLYTGYNPYRDNINYKTIWKSFKSTEGERITYQVSNLADTGFNELKDYIHRSTKVINYNEIDIAASPEEIKLSYPNSAIKDGLIITNEIPDLDNG